MREAALIVVVCLLTAIAPFSPCIGVLSYVWFGLMRPDILAWTPLTFWSQSLAIGSLIGSLRLWPRAASLVRNPIVCGLILLLAIIVVSAMFAVDPSLSAVPLTAFLKMMVMVLLIPLVIRSQREMKWLLLIMGGSVGFIGFKFGIWGLAQGGAHFNSGIGGFMSDNNTMAAGLAMSIPLCWYGRDLVTSKWAKIGLLVFALGSVSAIIMTHSRGGALALVVTSLVMLIRTRRKVLGVLVLAAAISPAVYMVRETYFDRLETLEHPEEESSARSRIEYAHATLKMWKDYPLLGVGFGTYNQMALWGRYAGVNGAVVHNTYLQMLVDSGTGALLVYVTLLWGSIIWLGVSVRQMRRNRPGLEIYPAALQASLVAFAVASTFLSQVRFDFIYILLAATASWREVCKDPRNNDVQDAQGRMDEIPVELPNQTPHR